MSNEKFSVTLLSSDVSEYSGWGRFTREFCLALYRQGIPFQLHLPKTSVNDTSLPFYKCFHFDLPPPFLSIGKRWWRLVRLWYESQKITVCGDLIHSLIEFPYGVIAYWLAGRYNLPFGITVYGTYAIAPLRRFPARYLYGVALKNAAFITAVSNFTKDRLIYTMGFMLPITVIHGGVNFSYFSSSQSYGCGCNKASHLDAEKSERIVLCVGALKARKGIDTLLKAFARVVQEEKAVRLIIVGSGDTNYYLQMADTLGIRKQVTFLGMVGDEELVHLYQVCDVFALLPREDEYGHFEGFGLVYLEANACGKPVVGTRSGGVPEVILDGVTGFLVPPENPDQAAKAILKLLRDENLRQTMGDAGRNWAQKHDWSQIITKYMELYEKTLRARQTQTKG